MKLSRFQFNILFCVSSYLVVLFGLVAIWLAGAMSSQYFAFLVLFGVIAFKFENTKYQVPERWGFAVLVLFVIASLVQWRFGGSGNGFNLGNSASVLARLIALLGIFKLFQKKHVRDWIFIYLIAFFGVVISAGISVNGWFVFSLSGFVISITFSIVCLEIISSQLNKTLVVTDRRSLMTANRMIGKRIGVISVILVLSILLLSVPLFLAFPRFGGAGFGGRSDSVNGVSGFSDSVSLGDISSLKLSHKAVLRASIYGDIPANEIYWRGVTLSRFDGKKWHQTIRNDGQVRRSVNGFFSIRFPLNKGATIVQEVYLEPIGSINLFSLQNPLSVKSNFRTIAVDSDGTVRAFAAGFTRTNYEVQSDFVKIRPEILRRDLNNVPTEIATDYLQLPADQNPKIKDFAETIIREARAETSFDKAKSIEQFLSSRFSYTLKPNISGKDPISEFLFNTRAGHCEYFASAMALMLRTQGIATRVVNGFQRGEFNKTSGMYLVRESDAHSWVEVYFPATDQWVRFDPTPPAGQQQSRSTNSIIGKIQNYLDALETAWIKYFVAYDSSEQSAIFSRAKDGIGNYHQRIESWFNYIKASYAEVLDELNGRRAFNFWKSKTVRAGGLFFGLVLLIMILALVLRHLIQNGFFLRVSKRFKSSGELTQVGFYRQMEAILGRGGFKRKIGQTPLEFAHEIDIPEAIEITESYNDVRFGGMSISSVDKQKIDSLLARLKQTLAERKKKGS
ncbi:MAG: DUF3488 and DUF4129 domain-containing transglutaminase family protein [Pyrinomonadaceae bacterium]